MVGRPVPEPSPTPQSRQRQNEQPAGPPQRPTATAYRPQLPAFGKGKVTGSSGGFILPSGANRAPDAAWLTPEQMASLTPNQRKKFLPLCPFFLIEVKSPSDVLKKLPSDHLVHSTTIDLRAVIAPMTIPRVPARPFVWLPRHSVRHIDNIEAVLPDPID